MLLAPFAVVGNVKLKLVLITFSTVQTVQNTDMPVLQQSDSKFTSVLPFADT